MSWIASVCTVSAMRFSRMSMYIEGIDDVHFFCPILVGDRVILKAHVNRSFSHSLEVGCRVEKLSLNGTLEHALTAYMILKVADNKPLTCEITAETDDEKKQWGDALGRYRVRLQRKSIRTFEGSLSPLLTPETELDIIYSNVKGLLMVFNHDDSQWESLQHLRKDANSNLHMSMKQSHSTGITCIRILRELNVDAEVLFKTLLDLSKRAAWDVTSDSATVLAPIDDNNDVIRLKMRPKAVGIKPQEFVLLRSWRCTPDQYVISNRSISYAPFPPSSDCARHEVLSSGFIIRKIDDESCEMSYIIQLGNKALNLVIGDLIGDKNMFLKESFNKLAAIVSNPTRKE